MSEGPVCNWALCRIGRRQASLRSDRNHASEKTNFCPIDWYREHVSSCRSQFLSSSMQPTHAFLGRHWPHIEQWATGAAFQCAKTYCPLPSLPRHTYLYTCMQGKSLDGTKAGFPQEWYLALGDRAASEESRCGCPMALSPFCLDACRRGTKDPRAPADSGGTHHCQARTTALSRKSGADTTARLLNIWPEKVQICRT